MQTERFSLTVLLAIALAAAPAFAQRDEAAIKGMTEGYEKLAKADLIVPPDEAAAMLSQIADWRFRLPDLEKEEVRKLKLLNLHCAAADGDARRMVEVVDSIAFVFKDDPETHYGLFLAAVANADAKRGLDAIKAIGAPLSREQQLPWLFWVRGFRKVGEAAPETPLKFENARDLSPRALNRSVLALVFWRRDDIRDPDAFSKAVAPLRAWALDHASVKLVGANCDGASDAETAKQFEGAHDLKWESCVNGQELAKAYDITEFPAVVIVDSEGLIRTIGRPETPATHYSLRVATRYAEGAADYFPPRDAEGKLIKIERPSESAPASASSSGGAAPSSGDGLRDDPAAESRLREARTFIRTGMKSKAREILQAIIRDYPGTKQAVEAQQRLADL
ncbi:MAG: hypothetical protein KDA32_09105 [Phycisphaerales bacterium]|nr:hypothetical protein [Phycisphaerales bacterium]